jgi:hypothetical protein
LPGENEHVEDPARAFLRVHVAEEREQRRRDGLAWKEAEPLLAALEAAGVDTVDFGQFSDFTTFDFARATPILIDWLPRVDDPRLKEVMARSLTGQRGAQGAGAQRLIAEFRRPDYAEHEALRWAIANALATLAGPADADDIIDLLRDRRYGKARQMLCDALARTRDPRRDDVLVALIADDDVAGHAILALRRISRRGFAQPARLRRELEALLGRPSASEFAGRQANAALSTLNAAEERLGSS